MLDCKYLTALDRFEMMKVSCIGRQSGIAGGTLHANDLFSPAEQLSLVTFCLP